MYGWSQISPHGEVLIFGGWRRLNAHPAVLPGSDLWQVDEVGQDAVLVDLQIVVQLGFDGIAQGAHPQIRNFSISVCSHL